MHVANPLSRLEAHARRLSEILGVLGRYGLADWLGKIPHEGIRSRLVSPDGERIRDLGHEARVRLALTELGTTFVKLGQMLGTRPDLLSPAQADELAKLQSHLPADPPDVVRALVEKELGEPTEKLFQRFEEIPVASASIGQVHRAWLPDGTPVVVKVQHAGIEEPVWRDLDLMEALAELLQQHVPSARSYQPVAVVRDFRRSLMRELDFQAERRNLEEFGRAFADNPHVKFPAVYPSLCSRRVLVMEWLDGIPGTDLQALQGSGADLDALSRHAASMFLDMVFRNGFYHADPHPGNFLLLPGGVLGVIDCGMVGRMDDAFREDFEELLLAVVQRDTEWLTGVVLRLVRVPPELDRNALRADLAEFFGELTGQAIEDFDLAGVLLRFVETVRRHKLVLPSAAAMLLRTFVLLEGTAKRLSPGFSLAELLGDYRRRNWVTRALSPRLLAKVQLAARDWERLLVALPGNVAVILNRLRQETFEIHHVHGGLERTVNRLIVGVLTAALLVSSSLLLGRGTADGLGRVLAVVGGLGLVVASAMGFLLLREIYRSKDR
jgi:ubiquinone biosynthesis protein